jgi:segregation and condensation protein A
MEELTFRLESVIKSGEDLDDFEGPLTLILSLLSKNKIEIRDIRISEILDQYLEYLDRMKAMDLEIASEFVAMASHLVYIKTRMLLNAGEEINELEELIAKLETLKCRDIYSSIKESVLTFGEMYKRGGGLIVKPPEPDEQKDVYRYSHDLSALLKALSDVFDRAELLSALKDVQPVAVPQKVAYSVEQKSKEIIDRLRGCGTLRLALLFDEIHSRSELVAAFIAVLDLCKDGLIYISEDNETLLVTAA